MRRSAPTVTRRCYASQAKPPSTQAKPSNKPAPSATDAKGSAGSAGAEKAPKLRNIKVSKADSEFLMKRTPTELAFAKRFFEQSNDREFIGSARLLTDLTFLAEDNESFLPEVCFAGRSNVGKSTLLNAVMNRKLARVSASPGHTRTLNFYRLRNALHIVDLPGYGYAAASKADVKEWHDTLEKYLSERRKSALKRTFLLLDAKLGPQKSDEEMMDFLQGAASPFQAVITKVDKLSKREQELRVAHVQKLVDRRPMAFPVVVAVSALKGYGIDELRAEILGAVDALPKDRGVVLPPHLAAAVEEQKRLKESLNARRGGQGS